ATDTVSSTITGTSSGILVTRADLDRLFEDDAVDPDNGEVHGNTADLVLAEQVAILTSFLADSPSSSDDPGTASSASAGWKLLCAGGMTWMRRRSRSNGHDLPRRRRQRFWR